MTSGNSPRAYFVDRQSVTSDTPVRVLVIYSPPYGESPEKVIKG